MCLLFILFLLCPESLWHLLEMCLFLCLKPKRNPVHDVHLFQIPWISVLSTSQNIQRGVSNKHTLLFLRCEFRLDPLFRFGFMTCLFFFVIFPCSNSIFIKFGLFEVRHFFSPSFILPGRTYSREWIILENELFSRMNYSREWTILENDLRRLFFCPYFSWSVFDFYRVCLTPRVFCVEYSSTPV